MSSRNLVRQERQGATSVNKDSPSHHLEPVSRKSSQQVVHKASNHRTPNSSKRQSSNNIMNSCRPSATSFAEQENGRRKRNGGSDSVSPFMRQKTHRPESPSKVTNIVVSNRSPVASKSSQKSVDAHFRHGHRGKVGFANQDQGVKAIKEHRAVPRLALKRAARTPMDPRRKNLIKLSDFGVTFDKYKAELERGITFGYKPHFGYPLMQFEDVKEGLSALSYEDATGKPDPIMQIVNQDSIDKFQNLLLSTQKAKMKGSTMVIDEPPKSLYQTCWLYNFIQQTEKRNVQDMVTEQTHLNQLIDKVNLEFMKGASLSGGQHLVRENHHDDEQKKFKSRHSPKSPRKRFAKGASLRRTTTFLPNPQPSSTQLNQNLATQQPAQETSIQSSQRPSLQKKNSITKVATSSSIEVSQTSISVQKSQRGLLQIQKCPEDQKQGPAVIEQDHQMDSMAIKLFGQAGFKQSRPASKERAHRDSKKYTSIFNQKIRSAASSSKQTRQNAASPGTGASTRVSLSSSANNFTRLSRKVTASKSPQYTRKVRRNSVAKHAQTAGPLSQEIEHGLASFQCPMVLKNESKMIKEDSLEKQATIENEDLRASSQNSEQLEVSGSNLDATPHIDKIELDQQIKSIVDTLKKQVKIRPIRLNHNMQTYQNFAAPQLALTSQSAVESEKALSNESMQVIANSDSPLQTQDFRQSCAVPSRFYSRKKLRNDIKQNRSVMRRKFDKTYKYLSLQLDQDMTSFDGKSATQSTRHIDPTQFELASSKQPSPQSSSQIKLRTQKNLLTYGWASPQMKIMHDQGDSMSEVNSCSRQTASQTAISQSSYLMKQRRLKNDFLRKETQESANFTVSSPTLRAYKTSVKPLHETSQKAIKR